MRAETPENHAYINAKIWQFWIGHTTAYTKVLQLSTRTSLPLFNGVGYASVRLSITVIAQLPET